MEEKEKREAEADDVRYGPGDGGGSWGSPHHTELFSLDRLVGVVMQCTEHARSALALLIAGSHSVPLADFS